MVISKKIISLSILFFNFIFQGYSQINPIEIKVAQDSVLHFLAKNNSNERHEVVLEIEPINLKGYEGSVTKLVDAGETIEMTILRFEPNKAWSYKTNYGYEPKPTAVQTNSKKIALKSELLNSADGLKNGIAIFTKEECTRSAYIRDYMNRKKISHTELKTDKNEFYNRLVLSLLRIENPDIKEFVYPVVVIGHFQEYFNLLTTSDISCIFR